MFNKTRFILGAAASSLMASAHASLDLLAVARQPHHMGRTRYTGGYRPARSRYRPHQGAQEVARRQQQATRDAIRQCDRASASCYVIDGEQKALPDGYRVSRRGRIVSFLAIAEQGAR